MSNFLKIAACKRLNFGNIFAFRHQALNMSANTQNGVNTTFFFNFKEKRGNINVLHFTS